MQNRVYVIYMYVCMYGWMVCMPLKGAQTLFERETPAKQATVARAC